MSPIDRTSHESKIAKAVFKEFPQVRREFWAGEF
jgi:hypothetical protein